MDLTAILDPTGKEVHACLVELTGEQAYLPLAAGYLTAYAAKSEELRRRVRISMVLEHAQAGIERLMRQILRDGVPDLVAFSCQGWAMPMADEIVKRLHELKNDIFVVYGGNHVSHEGQNFFRERPNVNVLVNGEGEETFREILVHYLDSPQAPDLSGVPGLSFQTSNGDVVTNADRERLADLDEIPSPYLSGILDHYLANCETALLETNRGCPYHCSFCYWGQAVGQRLHAFSLDRLRAEMKLLAERGVDSWYICDANFGILPQDAEIVDEIVRLRGEYGFPRTVHTNWAKNSNQRIVALCAKLNNGGVHSTYTLALQSTTEPALQLANRANMKINKIHEIARLCRKHGVVPRGELIWGLPGESYTEFLQSYDDLAGYTDALSVYPLYILPNTEYYRRRDELGIVTQKAEPDTDYAYCVQHSRMNSEDYLRGLRFIISNNILKVGGILFRLYPRIAWSVAGIPYHQTIDGLSDWVLATNHPVAQRFKKYYEAPLTMHRQSLTEVWLTIKRDRDGLLDMVSSYLESTAHASLAGQRDKLAVLREALKFDAETYPIVDSRGREEQESVDGRYVRTAAYNYDFLSIKHGDSLQPDPRQVVYSINHPAGLWRYPIENWYFGLIGYQAKVERVPGDPAGPAEGGKTTHFSEDIKPGVSS